MRKHLSFHKIPLIVVAITSLLNPSLFAQENVAPEKASFGYDKGYVLTYTKDYELKLNGRIQTRAQYNYIDSTKNHDVTLTVPNARLGFSGHVFDPNIGFVTQIGYEAQGFRVVDFYALFGIVPGEMDLRAGHFFGHYSFLESRSPAKSDFADRSFIFAGRAGSPAWKLDGITGFALHRSNKKPVGFNVSIGDNGPLDKGNHRQGAVAANVTFNHNELDASEESDIEGGPLRFIASLGGFARTRADSWKFIGYAGTIGGMAKVENFSFGLEAFTGVPKASLAEGSTDASPAYKNLKDEHLRLGAYAHAGYVFDRRYGLAARYALSGDFQKAPQIHEILGGATLFVFDHNVKVNLDGGVFIEDSKTTPQVRAQLQLAF